MDTTINKKQVFETVKTAIEQKIVTSSEIISFVKKTTNDDKESIVPKVLYSIGGIIALVGVLVLLGNNWDVIGFAGRWLSTVGFGLITFMGAMIVRQKGEYNVLSQVFFILSAITLFIGGFVWIAEENLSLWDGADTSLLVAGILLVVFVIAQYTSKKNILYVINTFFFSVIYYALVFKIIDGDVGFAYNSGDIVIYASMILAIGYFFYGFWIQKSIETASESSDQNSNSEIWFTHPEKLANLYTFLAFGLFLFSALFLDGIWNLIYAFLAIGSVILSIRLKSKIGLIITSITIGIYSIKISVEYFADSISFSLALLAAGLLIIALGYLTYYLNKKYITEN